MITTQVLQMALDALEESQDEVAAAVDEAVTLWSKYPTRQHKITAMQEQLARHKAAIAAIEKALAEPKQEPVAHVAMHRVGLEFFSLDNYCINAHCDLEVGQPLYLAPQPEPALVAAAREALSEFYFGDCDEPVLCRKMHALRKALAEPDPDADWRSATGYATPAEYRADRDKGLNAALAESKQEPIGRVGQEGEYRPTSVCWNRDTHPGMLLYAAPIPEPALVAAARAVVEHRYSPDRVLRDAITALSKALP